MTQSIRTRKFHQQTLVLLQRPASRITLAQESALKLLDMLSAPVALESMTMLRLQDLRHTPIAVEACEEGIALNFDREVSSVSMGAEGVSRLTKQVQQSCVVLNAS